MPVLPLDLILSCQICSKLQHCVKSWEICMAGFALLPHELQAPMSTSGVAKALKRWCTRYYEEKGFSTIATARICNLLALGFTVCFSGFLLMIVDWHGVLHSTCLFENTCEIQEVRGHTLMLKLLQAFQGLCSSGDPWSRNATALLTLQRIHNPIGSATT